MAKKQIKTEKPFLFSKEQILKSEKYSNRRDALGVILSDSIKYSLDEVDELLNNFMKTKRKGDK